MFYDETYRGEGKLTPLPSLRKAKVYSSQIPHPTTLTYWEKEQIKRQAYLDELVDTFHHERLLDSLTIV
jgi:hypothetical protein